MASLLGGTVERANEPVHGRTSQILHDGSGLFAGVPQGFSAVRYHSLVVRNPMPRGLRTTAWTTDDIPMALEHVDRPLWGVQFHPESIASEHGAAIFENFRRLARQRFSYIQSEAEERKSPMSSQLGAVESGGWTVFSRKIHEYASPEATF